MFLQNGVKRGGLIDKVLYVLMGATIRNCVGHVDSNQCHLQFIDGCKSKHRIATRDLRGHGEGDSYQTTTSHGISRSTNTCGYGPGTALGIGHRKPLLTDVLLLSSPTSVIDNGP